MLLEGQQHHGDEGAQRHGRQGQHQLPQPAGEARLLCREPPAQQEPEDAENRRPQQPYHQIIELRPVQHLHIGVQQGADGHLQTEEDDAHRQPARQISFRTQEKEQEVHR